MGEEDVKETGSPSESDEESQDKSLETSGADADKSDKGDKSKSPSNVPYDRFKQVVDRANSAEKVVQFYQQFINSEDDLAAFRKWKADQVKKAEKAEEEGEITPQKLEAIRKLMRKADPEYAEMLAERETDKQERIDAQFDEAEEQIRELAKTAGVPNKEEIVARLARQVMLEINEDKKLLRMWNTGNLNCIKKAFKIVEENFLNPVRKSTVPVNGKQAADKRRILRMPTLPAGGGAGVTAEKSTAQKEKGITKQTHEDAWAYLQQLRSEE
jgi:hypothetical protein